MRITKPATGPDAILRAAPADSPVIPDRWKLKRKDRSLIDVQS